MPKPSIKTSAEIGWMRQAGSIACKVLRKASHWVVPGITTQEIDTTIGSLIHEYGATSAFFRYRDFPMQACISVNEGVIHGIGDKRILRMGDLVKLDIGVRYQGFVGDVAMTAVCGGSTPVAQSLIDVTIRALYEGVREARAGNFVGAIGRAVQSQVESNGFSVVREFCGHGVGRSVHEEPQVPNYVERGRSGARLRAGMVIAIEPMVTEGSPAVEILKDGWTVVTKDRKMSAHFEHTVLITENEPEILTRDELQPLY